jgi:hypothetical protein
MRGQRVFMAQREYCAVTVYVSIETGYEIASAHTSLRVSAAREPKNGLGTRPVQTLLLL